MVKQGILITPVLGEVLTNLAPLRMKHSASVPAYHKGKPTWLSLYLSHVPHTSSVSLTLCKGNNVLTGGGFFGKIHFICEGVVST